MIDLNALTLPNTSGTAQRPQTTRVVAPLHKGRFLKGPIDWSWLAIAGTGKGRALHVALALLLERGMRSSDTVRLSYERLSEMGVDRDAGSRGLKELERLRLVHAVRKRGRSPVVTILKTGETNG